MAAPRRHNPLELLFTSLLVMPLLVMLSVLHNICRVMMLHNRDGVKCTMLSGHRSFMGVVGNTLFRKYHFMLYLSQCHINST